MCYTNLQKFSVAEVIQRHIFIAIFTCQIASGSLVVLVCTTNLMDMMDTLEGADAKNAFVVNFNFFFLPFIGGVGLILGVFYSVTTNMMHKYDQATSDLPATQEATKLVGQRVLLTDGTWCIVQHVVDKPRFNGQRAQIMGNGVDADSGDVQ